jgi:prophage regulatory protein
MINQIYRLPAVLKATGLRRSTVYRMIKKGEFPRQIKLGVRSSGWLESDIKEWIESRQSS